MKRVDRPFVAAGPAAGSTPAAARRASRLGTAAAAAAVLAAAFASPASAFSGDGGDAIRADQDASGAFLVADVLRRPGADQDAKSAKSGKKSAKSAAREPARGSDVRAPAQPVPAVVPPALVRAPATQAAATPRPAATPAERITDAEVERLLSTMALSPAQADALAALVGGGLTGDDLRRQTVAEVADLLAASGAPAQRVREVLRSADAPDPAPAPPRVPQLGLLGRIFGFFASIFGR